MNTCKSKVKRRSRYGNGGRMHVILNSEQLALVDYFKYLGSSQVAAEDVKGKWYTECMRVGVKSAENFADQERTGDKDQEVSI